MSFFLAPQGKPVLRQPAPRSVPSSIATWGLGAALLLAGCGGSSGPPKATVYPVKGKLTLDGEAIGPASFLMLPTVYDKANPRPAPAGAVDAEGNITISCYAKGDGAPEGDYQIQFVPSLAGAPKKPIPQIYFNPSGSGINVKIDKKSAPEANELTLALDSKGKSAGMSPGSAATARPGGGKNYPAIDPKLLPKTE